MPLTSTNPATAQALHPAFRLILPYLRPIERLILDPEISEIMINSPSDVFIEKQGVLERISDVTISADQLRVAVQNIARSLGDDISEEKPVLDSRLPDGSRIAAVLPPCSIQGITLTIRKFNARSFTIRDLLKASLRHRPERTILGEIRGEEAFDLLQALNTGHSGSLSTIHANSARQALSRLASCVLQSGIELPYKAIKASIADSIHLLVHVERRHGSRCIEEILSVESYSPTEDSYQLKTVFKHNQPLTEK